MKIGVLSDAHGNETGFFQCFGYLQQHTDKIYFLGDAVGYFPLSNNIIDTLRENNFTCLKGNHDAMLLGELEYNKASENIYQVEKGKKVISSGNLAFLKSLPSSLSETINGRSLLFVHGSPSNPINGYFYPDTDLSLFSSPGHDVVFMGHTHRPFIRHKEDQLVVNVGSCGLPRDIGNRLTTAIYDCNSNEIQLVEFELDTTEVITKYGNDIHESVKEILNRNHKVYGG